MAAQQKTKNSPKTLWIILAVVLVLLLCLFLVKKPTIGPSTKQTISEQSQSFDFGNQKIMLDNQELTFVKGLFSSTDPQNGHVSASITNRTLNPSGTRAAAILVKNTEGSGTFYYVVGGMQKDGAETYSTPMLLGDRIKVVSVRVENPEAHDNGEIVVQYLDRADESPMATDPTVQMTKKYSFEDNGNLIEVLH